MRNLTIIRSVVNLNTMMNSPDKSLPTDLNVSDLSKHTSYGAEIALQVTPR